MASRLGYSNILIEKSEDIYKELIKMKPSDIINYQDLISVLYTKLSFFIEKETNTNNNVEVLYDQETNNLYVSILLDTKKINVDTLGEEYPFTFINRRVISVPVYVMVDKPIMEQYQDIVDSVKKFDELIYNRSLENEENRLK